jgi:hypothetical protein
VSYGHSEGVSENDAQLTSDDSRDKLARGDDDSNVLPPPPGLEDAAQLRELVVPGLKPFVQVDDSVLKSLHIPSANASQSSAANNTLNAAAPVRRRPPAGPPPAWALSGSSAPPSTAQKV